VSIDGRFSSASPFATLASTMTSRTKQRGSNKRFSFVGKKMIGQNHGRRGSKHPPSRLPPIEALNGGGLRMFQFEKLLRARRARPGCAYGGCVFN
jgi:hypothetical protein